MNTEPLIRWDDVVFENRNKTYGAFIIRKSYHSNLSRSTAASLLIVVVLFVGTRVIINLGSHLNLLTKPPHDGGIILDPPPQVIPEVKIERTIMKPASVIQNLPPRIVTATVDNPPIIDSDPIGPAVSNTAGDGNPAASNADVINYGNTPATVEPPKTLDVAEVMPEFEGGIKALHKFLRKNLHYPAVAERTSQEGTVFVRFVIDVEGNVTNVEVVKSITGALDREASRVISILPKWKPGKQHDRPVNVRMVMPIKFELGN